MLKLLLDEHISPDVGEALRSRNKGMVIHWIAEWQGGKFVGEDDSLCLTEAAAQDLTFVTYDRRTIPPLLKAWIEDGRGHSGVIFVDEKTISPSDIGGLVRGLTRLWKERKDWDWSNRICQLERP